MVTGIVLTRAFSNVDMENSLLVQVFGYNNVCINFDHPPSTYVLPFMWAATLVLLLGYIVAHWLQMRAQVQEGTLGRGTYNLLSNLKFFEGLTLVVFSTCFAVHPEAWDHTLYIHTAPFFLLQVGLVSLAMSNTLHGIKSGYWRELELPDWFEKAAKFYCAFFALIVALKIPVTINAMTGGLWWEHTAAVTKGAEILDQLFFLCAAIVPMAKALYLVRTRGDKLNVVQLTTRTT